MPHKSTKSVKLHAIVCQLHIPSKIRQNMTRRPLGRQGFHLALDPVALLNLSATVRGRKAQQRCGDATDATAAPQQTHLQHQPQQVARAAVEAPEDVDVDNIETTNHRGDVLDHTTPAAAPGGGDGRGRLNARTNSCVDI